MALLERDCLERRRRPVYESQMSLWGALMGGCNFILHAAGWLESGLTASYEKFILDIEMLQMFAGSAVGATPSDLALEAVAEVGGREGVSGCAHTMEHIAAPSMRRWCPTGAIPANGPQDGAKSGDAARHRSGRAPCKVMLRRRAVSSRRWIPMSSAAKRRRRTAGDLIFGEAWGSCRVWICHRRYDASAHSSGDLP